ncbi:MAG TPA: thiamine pyrophosphate-binding protein, partial [Bacteroidales bacterium]|nr:thiamine pyrophosphate-binding protein [Bacteroidales bacterium]
MEITVADYIASQLFKAGVRYVFGIPGGPSIPYIEAFSKAGIRFILVSNEAAAGIMADVTSRITGIPGICHATFGPGATNISTGIGGALLDRSAVIVLTSEMDDDFIHRTAQMNISHQKLFEPITKATFRVDENNVAEILERSLSICKTEYPGPVHLGLPSGTALKEVISSNDGALKFDNKTFRNEPDKIRKLLEQSRRPLIAAGLTAKRVLKNNELTDFLDRCKIPVIVTPMAKGIIPAGHPCYAGVLFHALSNYLEDIYEKCDLVIGLGYDQVEYNYESWLP